MRIFLGGFPGSGKTTVGRILSRRLNIDFIDLDEEIMKREGKSIMEIFKRGEGYFRFVESEVLKDVISRYKDAVISLGGGTVTIKDNLHMIRDSGILVSLIGDEKILFERAKEGRPLVKDFTSFSYLIKKRERVYKVGDFIVDTTGKNPDDIAREVEEKIKLDVKIVRVNLFDRSYNIVIGKPKIEFLEGKIKGKLFIVSQRSVLEGRIDRRKSIRDFIEEFFPYEKIFIVLPEGEKVKSIRYANFLWNFLSRKKATKNDVLVYVGGGVLGDLVGFCAGTFARGISYIAFPTTLLAQVDSAIGGKTAINTKYKNMVGIIYQPMIVFSYIDFLRSLDERSFISGLGEVAKYSIIEKNFFNFVSEKRDKILNRDEETLKEVVEISSRIKSEIVSEDEFEEIGKRMILNLGHTIGHAIESSTDYKISHGEAISIGLYVESLISDIIYGRKSHIPEKIKELLIGLNLPVNLKLTKKFFSALEVDKKRRGNKIKFPAIKDIGEVELVEMNIEDFVKIVKSILKMKKL